MNHSRKIILLFFSCIFFSCVHAKNVKESRLIQTFNFFVIQQNTLEEIRNNFPQLISKATIAEIEFNKKYGKALSAIFFEVKAVIKKRGLDFKVYLTEIKKRNLEKMSKIQAISFIKKVKNRAKGNMLFKYVETFKKYENIDVYKVVTYKN